MPLAFFWSLRFCQLPGYVLVVSAPRILSCVLPLARMPEEVSLSNSSVAKLSRRPISHIPLFGLACNRMDATLLLRPLCLLSPYLLYIRTFLAFWLCQVFINQGLSLSLSVCLSARRINSCHYSNNPCNNRLRSSRRVIEFLILGFFVM